MTVSAGCPVVLGPEDAVVVDDNLNATKIVTTDPLLVSGRQVWLCWRLGEESVGWWHGLDTGFDGRRPLAELA